MSLYIKLTINPYHYILKVPYPPQLPCHCPHLTVIDAVIETNNKRMQQGGDVNLRKTANTFGHN